MIKILKKYFGTLKEEERLRLRMSEHRKILDALLEAANEVGGVDGARIGVVICNVMIEQAELISKDVNAL